MYFGHLWSMNKCWLIYWVTPQIEFHNDIITHQVMIKEMAVAPSQILVHSTSLILCLCQSSELSQYCSQEVFCHLYQAALTQMFVRLSVIWLHFYNCFIKNENAVVEMRKLSDCLIKSLLTVFCFSLVFFFVFKQNKLIFTCSKMSHSDSNHSWSCWFLQLYRSLCC